jgi:integrase
MVAQDRGTRPSTRRSFGFVRRLPSKRFQASYVGPDLARHSAPVTFDAKIDAEAWLAGERKIIESDNWIAPKRRREAREALLPPTLTDFANGWLASRTLKPRTRAHYRQLLDRHILPSLGALRVDAITPTLVRQWHTGLGSGTPTLRAHAYGLLRTIMGTAVDEQLIERNPCVIRSAGSSKTTHKSRPATLPELAAIVEAMPPRYRLMVQFAAWCALRYGELAELRRSDLDLKENIIRVRRGVVRVPGEGLLVGLPKSDAGVRDVAIPPHLLPEIKTHLANHVAFGRDGLLFPAARDSGVQLAPATLYRHFNRAREAAGRPDLRWHDLRHTGGTLAAGTGASLAELMSRLGHSTVKASLLYQHAAKDRDQVIAAELSKMAGEITQK